MRVEKKLFSIIEEKNKATCSMWDTSFFKSEFMEVGIVFSIISMSLIGIPISIYFIIKYAKRKNGTLSTTFLVTNFCYILLFFALFLMPDDWAKNITSFNLNITLLDSLNIFLFSVISLLILSSLIRISYEKIKENFKERNSIKKIDGIVDFIANFIKYLVLLEVLLYDYIIFKVLPWSFEMICKFRYYWAMLILMGMIIVYLSYRFSTLTDRNYKKSLMSIGIIFSVIILYLTILSYSFTVYRYIPINRGGKYPISQAKIVNKIDFWGPSACLIDKASQSNKITKPLFIFDITNEFVYVTEPYSWLDKFPKEIISLNKKDISAIKYAPNYYWHSK